MEELELQAEQPSERKKRLHAGWWKIPLAVALTLVLSAGLWALLLGRSGLSLVQGYLLARFAFVEADADLASATDQALDALVDGLGDRWSYYRDEESYASLKTRRANRYVGVGITVSYDREEGLYIQSVTADGPADQAGVLAGEIITAVDGQSIAGDERYDGSSLITGEAGTQVELKLLGEDGTTRTVVCTRASLQNPSATGKLLEDSIGYVKLANFYSGAADSFQSVVDDLLSQGAESLIIDLRDDPGGYVSELTEILDYLLPEGEVFRQHPRWWFESVTTSDADCVDLPFVTIVNGDTYSAAELLAAELREFCASPVVGEQTSGKGYSQLTFPLLNGGAMGLSTATYYTGSGHSLIGEGITPDVELELSETEDNQLLAAMDLLR
jgi:carboxyl-terminal processing protease